MSYIHRMIDQIQDNYAVMCVCFVLGYLFNKWLVSNKLVSELNRAENLREVERKGRVTAEKKIRDGM